MKKNSIENFVWGELLEEEEPEEIDEAPIENYGDTTQSAFKADSDTKSGTSSIISGLDTPNIDIRKQPLMGKIQPMAPLINKTDGKANPFDNSGKPLYQILEPTQVNKQFFSLFIIF